MFVRVSRQGNVIEVTRMTRRAAGATVRKLDAGHYLNLATGEVCEYQARPSATGSRTDCQKSLRRTFKTIRGLVNTNCTEPGNIRWITLTYAENMTDTERLYSDFKNFWKRFKRRWGQAEYISVIEPQGRGAWHVHLIAIYDHRAPFIDNAELAELWGQGFVNVQRVESIDNLGAYLSAYLGDVEMKPGELYQVDPGCSIVEKTVDGQKKKFIKGGRLHFYPAGMQIYRCSRGIKKPTEQWVTQDEADAIAERYCCTYAPQPTEIVTQDGFRMVVEKKYFNAVRNKSDGIRCDWWDGTGQTRLVKLGNRQDSNGAASA